MFKKWMEKSKKDQRGLTLVELLAVVVILAIVAAIAFVLIGNVIENSKKDAHIANAQQIISAAKMYDSTEGITNNEVTYEDLKKAQLIGELTSPWKDETYPDAGQTPKVTKTTDDDGVTYEITGFDVSEKCSMGTITEKDLNGDRKNICN